MYCVQLDLTLRGFAPWPLCSLLSLVVYRYLYSVSIGVYTLYYLGHNRAFLI